jgi:ParB family chromosome partitioning protein
VAEGWTVRKLEEAARARANTSGPATPSVREVRPVEIIELEQRLRDKLDSRVNISYRNRQGKVEIAFGSLEELERIYRRFFT